MRRLEVSRFGPIPRAVVEFGDLTVLVGPQASGKSLFVQLAKAIADAGAIRNDLKRHGFDWIHGSNLVSDYSSLYFGGGLQSLIDRHTTIRFDGRSVPPERIAKPGGNASAEETVLLVPAQRVLVLQDGWPKHFRGYSAGDPYSMRRFSELLRTLLESGLASGETLFPQPRRLMTPLRNAIDHAIYDGFKLMSETEGVRKHIVLQPNKGGPSLPFNAWSAGQREFTPLLLTMYWLMPPTNRATRESLTDVIIEEPEMGLHPQAILSFMLLVMALLHRGYRVTLSTHSPVVLDVLWALGNLRQVKQRRALSALRSIFQISRGDNQINATLQSALKSEIRAFYFDRARDGITVRDISGLDPGSTDEATAGWGGLSGFSGGIAEAVGDALATVRG